jgi:hypothetical protein
MVILEMTYPAWHRGMHVRNMASAMWCHMGRYGLNDPHPARPRGMPHTVVYHFIRMDEVLNALNDWTRRWMRRAAQ